MNIKVLYNSKGGSTKKLAEAIADAAGVLAEPIIGGSSLDEADLLFIGDGNYGSTFDKKTKNFIKTLTPDKVKNAVVFGTYGRDLKAIIGAEELLKNQGIKLTGKNFGCPGNLPNKNTNHPEEKDLEAAKKFAINLIQELYNAL